MCVGSCIGVRGGDDVEGMVMTRRTYIVLGCAVLVIVTAGVWWIVIKNIVLALLATIYAHLIQKK